jgi:Protein of unknown function (DUF2950)
MNKLLALLFAAGLSVALTTGASAQKSFKTAQEGADALAAAARANDQKAIVAVLGPGGAGIASSGDPVADEQGRKTFVAAYDAKRNIDVKGDRAVIVIGKDDWPFPIPLVQKDGNWRFDTAAGRDELLARRIGRNELAVIQAALAYVDAQDEYSEISRKATGTATYAQRIISNPGKKDGLYWPSAQGEPESPLGDTIAAATSQGYKIGAGRTPYHGYYYKILTRQGPAAPGGALDYVARGKMIGGHALVAYPAQYGNSGITTFLVNHQGTVFEKDLGPKTAQIVQKMRAFSPDKTWKKVEAGK